MIGSDSGGVDGGVVEGDTEEPDEAGRGLQESFRRQLAYISGA